jgi:bifunctional N-acetylglucosamine-1-phosphate-uridyltransferase/glucosamine-1-phosphate-acetyltransferase GlmU-like protein
MHNQVVVVHPKPAAVEMVGRTVVVAENFVVVHIAEQVDSTAEQQVVRQVRSTVARQVRQQLSPWVHRKLNRILL